MSEATRLALQRLERVASDTTAYLDNLLSPAERASRKSSSTLFGATGGVIGTVGAITISHLVAIPLLVLGAPLTALGILTGVLLYRGPKRFRLERRLAENRLAADEILSRIQALPPNAPEEIKEGLWRTYSSLTAGFESQSTALLNPPRQ